MQVCNFFVELPSYFLESDVSDNFKQEPPLTLRGQHSCCRNIKGEPQIFGSFRNPRPLALFPLGVIS